MPSLSTRLDALEKNTCTGNTVDAIIVVSFVTPNEKNEIRALSNYGRTWVRGDDEAEDAFIDRASAEVHYLQPGAMVAMLMQIDPPAMPAG